MKPEENSLKNFLPRTHCGACVRACVRACGVRIVKTKSQFILAFSQRNSFLQLAPWFQPVQISICDICDGALTSGLAEGDEHVC